MKVTRYPDLQLSARELDNLRVGSSNPTWGATKNGVVDSVAYSRPQIDTRTGATAISHATGSETITIPSGRTPGLRAFLFGRG